MKAKLWGVVHEAVFDISEGPADERVVRLPFPNQSVADRRCPLIVKLVSNPDAKGTCAALHQALEVYLGADERCATDVVTSAAAVVAYLDFLCERLGDRG